MRAETMGWSGRGICFRYGVGLLWVLGMGVRARGRIGNNKSVEVGRRVYARLVLICVTIGCLSSCYSCPVRVMKMH